MLASYERKSRKRKQGKLPATIEVIYGHAWKEANRVRSPTEGGS